MESKKIEYWFCLYQHVYFCCPQENKLLLYNTQNGLYIETNDRINIQLIKDIYEPVNLGAIKVEKEQLISSNFINEIVAKDMGYFIEIKKQVKRPVNLLPILNIQKDVEKLISQNENLMGNDIISYLSELDVYINGVCSLNCSLCSEYYKQTKSCFYFKNDSELHPDILQNIFDQLKYSRVKRINLLGGNILQYSYWNQLIKIIKKYDFEFHLWINYRNLLEIASSILKKENLINEILITYPIQKPLIETIYGQYKHHTKFHFLIENEAQYIDVMGLIDNLGMTEMNIIPIFTAKNKLFFTKNVFLEKDDIFSSVISMREIFCNKKLNTNNFGLLKILPDGTIKANINSQDLGNIHQNTILEIIYKELIENTAWRIIRNNEVCNNCLYRFLCPPPSNYETVIGKPNLCHVHP